jgi:hypothetical protein
VNTPERNIHLTDAQYDAALLRFQQAIKDGIVLSYFDDTTPGCKDTQCTWGLCDDSALMWPKDTQLWPNGRTARKYLEAHQLCPFDKRAIKDATVNGCFYTCRVFQATKREPVPTREQAIELYDKRIAEFAAYNK